MQMLLENDDLSLIFLHYKKDISEPFIYEYRVRERCITQ